MMFSAGLLLALPVVAAMLISNRARHAEPSLIADRNFQIGFPVTMLVDMLLLQLLLPSMIPSSRTSSVLGIDVLGRLAAGLNAR